MKDEIAGSLKDTLKDRMNSPFTGSFMVSWVIINWKFILALVAGGKYAEKMAIYDKLYLSFWDSGVLYFIVYPLIGACFYISLYQLIIAGTLRIWFTVERAKAWGRRNKILTVEESQKLIIKNGELSTENNELKSNSVTTTEENKRYKQDVNSCEELLGFSITDPLQIKGLIQGREDVKNLQEVVVSTKKLLEDKENELHEAIKENENLTQCEEILSNEVASLKVELKEQKAELKAAADQLDEECDYNGKLAKENTALKKLEKARDKIAKEKEALQIENVALKSERKVIVDATIKENKKLKVKNSELESKLNSVELQLAVRKKAMQAASETEADSDDDILDEVFGGR